MGRVVSTAMIIILTVLSGVADAQGFIHASNMWDRDQLVWPETGKSAMGFGIGIFLYWATLRYVKEIGIVSPEIQTAIWFGVTIIGVAVLSGDFLRWKVVDQIVAFGILGGIGWLLVRTAH